MTENVLLCIIICFTVICVVSIAARMANNERILDKETSTDAMFYKLHEIALKRGATSDELTLFHKIYWKYIADYKEGDDKC